MKAVKFFFGWMFPSILIVFWLYVFEINGGRFFMDQERAGAMRITPHKYESWSLYYSDGMMWDYEKNEFKTLWSFPRYRHFELYQEGNSIKINANRLDPGESLDGQGRFQTKRGRGGNSSKAN